MGLDEKSLLTSKEVMEMFRISAVTLRRWREDGILPYLKLTSKSYRYPREGIEKLVRENLQLQKK